MEYRIILTVQADSFSEAQEIANGIVISQPLIDVEVVEAK